MISIQDNACFRARILYVPLTFSRNQEAVTEALRNERFAVSLHDPACRPAKSAAPADIILPDCRGSGFDPEFDVALLDRLRGDHPESVFMFLTDLSVPAEIRQQMKKYGSVCATGPHTELLVSRLTRMLDNLALADECGERLKTMLAVSSDTASRDGIKTSDDRLSVLVAGVPSPLSLRAIRSLERSGAALSAAISIPQILSYVENHRFDCLVLLPGSKQASHASLIKLLRRNGRSKNLPVLILSEEGELDQNRMAERYLRQGADLILSGQDTEGQLAREVSAFSRRNRLTRSMKQFLRKSVSADNNRKKYACTVPFFEAHLARQCASAQRTGKPLCLSGFRIRTQSGQPFTLHMQTQLLSYIDLIIQDIDLVTVAQSDILLISHPATMLDDAVALKERIVSVLQDISFRNETQATFKDRVIIAANTELYRADQSPEQLIIETLKGMAETMPMPPRREKPHLSLVQ